MVVRRTGVICARIVDFDPVHVEVVQNTDIGLDSAPRNNLLAASCLHSEVHCKRVAATRRRRVTHILCPVENF